MKLNEDFILHNGDGKTLLVPVGGSAFSGVLQGNPTLGAVLELLRRETDEEQITAALHGQFDAPDGAIERDVRRVLDALREIGALDE